jgi:hypothetical protein
MICLPLKIAHVQFEAQYDIKTILTNPKYKVQHNARNSMRALVEYIRIAGRANMLNVYQTSSDVDLLLWSGVGSVLYVICVSLVIWTPSEAYPICASLTNELDSQNCKLATGVEYGGKPHSLRGASSWS